MLQENSITFNIAIIGGGAAGFFAAISAKDNHPDARVVILEKSQKLLAKVKVSGGGRCNVANGTTSIKELVAAYPRGGKVMKKALQIFSTKDTMQWFQKRGIPLKVEADGRVFPTSNDSQSVIDCLMNECDRIGVKIETGITVTTIQPVDEKLKLTFYQDPSSTAVFDKVIVATGGSPKRSGLQWLEELGHVIEEPVPSLFTFNMPKEPIKELMGVVAENVITSVQGTKLKAEGPLLITHWGMSGPAILKLSAFGARVLHEMHYAFNVQLNWVNGSNDEEVSLQLRDTRERSPNKKIINEKPFTLPERLWSFLLVKSNIDPETKWVDLGKKGRNKLVDTLTRDVYPVKGKTTFKEEFVTCGGVSLDSIDANTMQSKVCPNLYFAGEVMDIDGITGGYNFQAAWTTGFIAGKLA